MLVYLLLFAFVFSVVVLRQFHVRLFAPKFFVFVSLLIVSALRYDVGIDTENYRNIYNEPDTGPALFVEPVYLKKSKYFYVSIVLFMVSQFYFESFNLARQYIAIAISFYSYSFLNKKRILLYILWGGIASQFHISAILPLIILPILHFIKFPNWFWCLTICATFLFGDVIIDQILLLFSELLSSFRYVNYLDNIKNAASKTGLFRLYLNFLALLFLAISYRVKYRSPFLPVFLLGVTFYNVFLYVDVMIRLSLYFTIYIILLCPVYITAFEKRSRIIFVSFIMISFFAFTFKILLGAHYIPYVANLSFFKW